MLCMDSFFGAHGLVKGSAASKQAFLMMTKTSTYGATWAGEQVQQGQTAVCTVAGFKYNLTVYKNCKVGHKPPPGYAHAAEFVVCPKGTTSSPKRSGSATRGGAVPHTITQCRWCEPDGPADEASWAPDDMGPRGACVRAPELRSL